jgi:dihydroorotate dehydrogenase electron transfer subunit
MLKPGRTTDPLLRRPFSVFEVLRDDSGRVTSISVLNKRIGPSTTLLFETDPGDRIWCLGPLGRPFTLAAAPVNAWMVAGGVGLAPFATLAEALHASGTPATLFYGARTGAELFHLEFFERLGVRLVLSTEDGSRGVPSRVTEPLAQALAHLSGAGQAMIYACGPEPMLAAVAGLAARYGQRCEVSVERVMGCGLGGCYSCVVPVRDDHGHRHLVRSCLAGPVLNAGEIVWD